MRTVLTAINASYVHTNPAVRSLAAEADERDVCFCEYNINQPAQDILYDLLQKKPEVVCFSCYIWNIGMVLRIAEDLKRIDPCLRVILGGPEVSFESHAWMRKAPFIDYIVCGEGETVLPRLLQAIETGNMGGLKSVLYREKNTICGDGTYAVCENLEAFPAPFSAAQDAYDENRIYYYEASRGCPFSCAYCLSGAIGGGVREKSVGKVKRDIDVFVQKNTRLVKFVDRTFNANQRRAKEIWRYVIERTGNTSFHFEVGLDLLDEEAITLLQSAPAGKIQLEAGIQSCNQKTLETVIRKTNMARLKHNARAILKARNIHLHLDLIAGLPYEDLPSFAHSFNEVYTLYPDALQLGFLKLLRGTALKERAGEYGITARSYAPYEVLKTNDITADELLRLREIAGLVDRYYNTGRMRKGFDYITKNNILQPFELYEKLYVFSCERGYAARPISVREQFSLIIAFAKHVLKERQLLSFLKYLKQDYIQTKAKGAMPNELAQID